MWYFLQNTEATALTTDFALRQLDCKQHGEHRTARYPVIVSFWETIYSSYNICSNSHFLPDVLAPVCANSIFNCEHIELANCSSAMLQLVNSTHRKPRAQSPSIGIIMQCTLLIGFTRRSVKSAGKFLYFPFSTLHGRPYTAINLDEFSTLHYYSALHSY